MSNPFSNARKRDNRTMGMLAADISEVLQVSHEGHALRVQVKGDSGPETVPMVVSEHGDVNVPSVGDLVVVVYGKGEKPIVIGTVYSSDETAPSTAEGERRLGHSDTLSYILFKNNGNININAEADVLLNGRDIVGEFDTLESNFTTHAANSSAHHTKYTDAEAVTAVESADPLELAGLLKVHKQGTDSGTGVSAGEVQRWGGPSSDLLLDIQGGHGRVAWMWNAYWDGSTYRYLTGGEPAMMMHMHTGKISLRTADAAVNADDVITWEEYDFESGNITVTNDLVAGRYSVRSGFLTGYLSTAQTTMETGKEANVFENIEVNDGPYTKDSSSQVTVNRTGNYRITWETGFQQVSGNSHAEMQSMPRINGVNRGEFRSYCYIRLANGNGDSNSCGNEAVLSLTSGDTLAIWASEYSATGYDHTLNHASATLEFLG